MTFRALLDVCMAKTKELPFFGERMWRENQYKDAFADFVNVINNNIKPDGKILSAVTFIKAGKGYAVFLNRRNIACTHNGTFSALICIPLSSSAII